MAIGIVRRQFISVLGGVVVAWPLAALAQSEKISRIGFLTRYSDASGAAQIDAFRQGLRDLGWVEGKTISIEYRDAEGQADRLRGLAAELVGLNVDVIVTVDTPPTQAAQQATRTIPIVIAENRKDAWHHGTAELEVVLNGRARLLRQLEADWTPGLSLAHRRTGERISARGNVFDLHRDDIAAS